MTSLVRTIARPLLASAFIAEGVDVLRRPDDHVAAATPYVDKATEYTGVKIDPRTAVKASALTMVAGGVLLGTSMAPRLAGAALGFTALPLAIVAHPFWKAPRAERRTERRSFITKAALAGGALLAAADRGGKPSRSWRRAEAKKQAEAVAKPARRRGCCAAKTAAE